MKRNIFKIILCSAFFILSCSNKKEKQLDKDLKFVSDQYDRLMEMEKSESFLVRRSFDDCFRKGIVAQPLISRYNSIQSILDSGYTKYKQLFDIYGKEGNGKIDTIRAETYRRIKKEILAFGEEGKYLSKYYIDTPVRFMDSCSKENHDASPRLKVSANKLEFLLLKKMMNDLFNGMCKTISICNWGWKPFSNGLSVKNYQKDKQSFLEIRFPYYAGPKFFKQLRSEESEAEEDTIPVSKLKISFVKDRRHEIDTTNIRIDLSNLKPGKYSVRACVLLERPDDKPTTYCEPIDFEVFK